MTTSPPTAETLSAGMRVVLNPAIPPGVIEIRDKDNNVLGAIVNVRTSQPTTEGGK